MAHQGDATMGCEANRGASAPHRTAGPGRPAELALRCRRAVGLVRRGRASTLGTSMLPAKHGSLNHLRRTELPDVPYEPILRSARTPLAQCRHIVSAGQPRRAAPIARCAWPVLYLSAQLREAA